MAAVASAKAKAEHAQAGKPKAKANAKASADNTPNNKGACKRPAAADTGTKAGKPAKLMRGGAIPADAPGMPECGSVSYMGGKVLHSVSRGGWRTWKNASEVARERLFKFGDSKQEAFNDAIRYIIAR